MRSDHNFHKSGQRMYLKTPWDTFAIASKTVKAIFGKEVEISENTNRDDRIDGVKTERISALSSFC